MHALLLLLIALASPQEGEPREVLIVRTDKDPYVNAVKELDKAAELIESEPAEAVAKITAILGNSRVKHFEVRLKIEIRPQEFDRTTFYPYFVRARAYMALGKRSPRTKDAMDAYQSAVADLEKSLTAKVPNSAAQLEEAKNAHKDAKSRWEKENTKDPIVEFNKAFEPMLANEKFRQAEEFLVGPEGQKLSEDQRKERREELERVCTGVIDRQIKRFRDALRGVSVRSLRETSDRSFRQEYSNVLPPDSELTEAGAQHATLKWARTNLKVLNAVRVKQAKAEDLFAGAAEALPLDPPDYDGENFWFNMMAGLGSDLIEEVVEGCAGKSESSPKADRARLREDSDKALGVWKEFLEKTDKKVLDRHPNLEVRNQRVDRANKGFAVELDLSRFSIVDCYLKNPLPGKALVDLERGLLEFESKLQGRVAIESRQELYTKIVNVGALWRILDGKQDSQVINEIRRLVSSTLGDKLREAGGALDPMEYGPKVKKVFDALY